jgi:hypothetical protein
VVQEYSTGNWQMQGAIAVGYDVYYENYIFGSCYVHLEYAWALGIPVCASKWWCPTKSTTANKDRISTLALMDCTYTIADDCSIFGSPIHSLTVNCSSV